MPIDTSSKEKCMSAEIKHLIAKGYDRDRAIAAASEICKKVERNEVIEELLNIALELRKIKND
ncbi:MAG: hypothetical protein GF411_17140 [Candidatus Lokiarchaeota archaeon]|nr:hypothetical protein [Candidatus Lokiarchaeota archaeon]